MSADTSALEPRLFADKDAIIATGEAFLARTLPKAAWTHEAHLAACVWLVKERPDIVPERDLPRLIASYNEATGGVNDDTQGYHETLTQFYIAAVRAHVAEAGESARLVDVVNALLQSPRGARSHPLQFYSRERLFSAAARRSFLQPDLRPMQRPPGA